VCACDGKVIYGADKGGKQYYNIKASNGSIKCTNAEFSDPIVGTVKSCFCSPSATANGGKPIGSGNRRMLRGNKRAARDNLCAIYMRHIFNMAKKN